MPVYDPITGRTWLSPKEAAAYLGKEPRWLTRQIQERRLNVHKRGGTNIFLLSDLEVYEAAHAPAALAGGGPLPVAEPPRKKRRQQRRPA